MQRMAGVCLNAVGLDEFGPRVGRGGDVLGDYAAGVAGGAAADRHAEVQPLHLLRLFFGDACTGVEVQLVHILVHEVVEEGMAVEAFHYFAAEGFHALVGRVGAQEFLGGGRQQFEAAQAVPERLLRRAPWRRAA